MPWRREGLPTPVFWPGEFHGLSPWGRKESDTTERLSLHSLDPHTSLQRLQAGVCVCVCVYILKLALVVKNLPASAGDIRDAGSIPGSGRSPREGNGNPLQCSCLENSMDRGAWQATVHGVTKSRTRLSNQHTHIIYITYMY